MSQRRDELEAMTELTAFLMALMLTVELGLAIAFVAAWLAARQPGEKRPACILTLKKIPMVWPGSVDRSDMDDLSKRRLFMEVVWVGLVSTEPVASYAGLMNTDAQDVGLDVK
jgi:hypothetical protein